jgi:ubiquitin carboxyl-terminal hydrolase 4/11/15
MKNSKVEPEGDVGPIDNSDIIYQIIKDSDDKDFVQLKPGLGQESFELFPPEVWNLVMAWHKLMPGTIPIIRYAHNTNKDLSGPPNVLYEFHPPVFRIHRLYSDNSGIMVPQLLKASNPPAPLIVFSRSTRYVDFLKKAKEKTQIENSRKVQVWRIPRLQPAAEPTVTVVNISTPPSSRPSSPSPLSAADHSLPETQEFFKHLLVPVPTFIELKKGERRELIQNFPDETNNPNYNGKSDLALVGLGDDQAIVLDEQLSTNSTLYVSSGKAGFKSSSTSYVPSNSQANSGRSSPAPSGVSGRTYNTRGRSGASGRTPGTVGLSNLGNTCYMNSALQCVRSVEELTKYFLSGSDIEELNRDNPLGNNGDVAVAYRKLLKEIYADPVPQSVAPRNFKNTIGKYAPSFSGYGQQDSQEFIGFLLDGLQEDLSRVKKKPYIEKPDSTDEMINNPEAIREMAQKVWDITKKRDDSVIADLFTGMYKSTLVCPQPDCRKVSITFDPFNNLTLQLPIESYWSHNVNYFPMNDKPITISVDLDKQATILGLKKFIGDRVGVPEERLMIAEHFREKFYKNHLDAEIASEAIGTNDYISVYELEAPPSNWPAPKKPTKKGKSKSMGNLNFGSSDSGDEIPGWDDPLAERLLVPVYYRKPTTSRGYGKKPWEFICPHYIIVTPEEVSWKVSPYVKD